ncbi:hypothetical protein VRRI112168_18170 [Vreelandella rituensis]|uniref:General stress protein 17M-like domain-containing protein n=1 Tax=Vreelandella rituensis TaxID=2282306 RepID=A0A368U8R1_9GAMM|nr:hypothetical protein [Halomonas rituensis]RCV92817.1 hypothetical protein DU506_05420 [Halomonas rituensis]
MVRHIAGVYESVDQALGAMRDLTSWGFPSEKFHLIGQENKTHEFQAGLVGKELTLDEVPEAVINENRSTDTYQKWKQHIDQGRTLLIASINDDAADNVIEKMKGHQPLEIS